ncbi:hypothetical protein [Streptomyces adustus]|uniref:hypothetical protein n=1 Tax=Streptomyces adustus TaxID=1609272 RepID=UPI003723611F
MRQREQYGRFYEGDFGLSELAGRLATTAGAADEAQSLRLASEVAALCEGEGAVELGVDVRCLLDSALPDGVIRTVWLAASHGCFDPSESEGGIRGWLRRLAERWPDRGRKSAPGHWLARPDITEEKLREAVVAEIRASAGPLGRIADDGDRTVMPSDSVAESLEAVAQEGDGDLGLRLFLSVLKVYDVPVGKEQYDRLMALDTALGWPCPLVYDGLNVLWPHRYGAPRRLRRFRSLGAHVVVRRRPAGGLRTRTCPTGRGRRRQRPGPGLGGGPAAGQRTPTARLSSLRRNDRCSVAVRRPQGGHTGHLVGPLPPRSRRGGEGTAGRIRQEGGRAVRIRLRSE